MYLFWKTVRETDDKICRDSEVHRRSLEGLAILDLHHLDSSLDSVSQSLGHWRAGIMFPHIVWSTSLNVPDSLSSPSRGLDWFKLKLCIQSTVRLIMLRSRVLAFTIPLEVE